MSAAGRKRDGTERGPGGGAGRAGGRAASLYRWFASLKTSIYLLGITAFFYTVGTIFPQGGDLDRYLEAGGRFVLLVRAFDLLNLFSSPLFLISAFLLFANLAVCTFERRHMLSPGTAARTTGADPLEITLTQDLAEAEEEVSKVLEGELRFRHVKRGPVGVVMEKGLPWRALTWLYHLGMIVCFIGFVLTYLAAYEDTATFWKNVADNAAPETTGRLQGAIGGAPGETDFSLLLTDFTTEYVESPELDYPDDAASRLAAGLGWIKPAYELTPQSIEAKDWLATIRVIDDNRAVKDEKIEVNTPLKYGGYTFYLIGFDYRLKFRVGGGPLPIEAASNEEFFVPGIANALRFKDVRTGSITRLDGTVEELVSYATIEVQTTGSDGEKRFEELGVLAYGEGLAVGSKTISMAGITEGVVLSYRYDPGMTVLWWAGILVLVLMSLRYYGSWYGAVWNLTEAGGIVTLRLELTSKGVFADTGRLKKRIEHHMTKDDLRPLPLD